ncbi:MAG: 16S rRNA (guanine(527)-N(7))-methyltransferase RsmG [Rickettsiaceae bacterium]
MQKNHDVSREISDNLDKYSVLLLKWNKTINLVSARTIADIDERHINDSIQLMHYIPNKNTSIIDFGSGAGLPGVVLSICGIREVTLIESDERKAAFLLQVAKISSTECKIINDRIENQHDLNCDILTSRATADLNSIFHYCRNIKVRDKYLLHKGKSYAAEIEEARKHWLFDITVHDSITSSEGKILEITALKPHTL